MVDGEVPEQVVLEEEVYTTWGYPQSIDPESVFLLGENDFALTLESTANTRKPVLCKAQQLRPVFTIGNYMSQACFDKMDNFYCTPDYNDILGPDPKQVKKNTRVPPTVAQEDDMQSQKSTSSDRSKSSIKQASSSPKSSAATKPAIVVATSLKVEPIVHKPSSSTTQSEVGSLQDSGPVTTYDDLGLRDSTGAYICNYCPVTFPAMNDMKAHCISEHNSKPFKCKICDKLFNTSRSLLVHTFCHTGEKHYKCPYCSETFRQTGHRNSHVKLFHNNSLPVKCDQCLEHFKGAYELKRHVRKNHKVEKTKCHVCMRSFSNPNQLKVHQCIKRERNLNCGACGEAFFRMKDVLTHAKFCKFVDDSDVTCEKCGSVFPNAARCSVHKTYLCTGKPIVTSTAVPNEVKVKEEVVDYDENFHGSVRLEATGQSPSKVMEDISQSPK